MFIPLINPPTLINIMDLIVVMDISMLENNATLDITLSEALLAAIISVNTKLSALFALKREKALVIKSPVARKIAPLASSIVNSTNSVALAFLVVSLAPKLLMAFAMAVALATSPNPLLLKNTPPH